MSYMGYNNNYEEPSFSGHKDEPWAYEDNPNDNVNSIIF